jgi:hypothetical protein
LFDHSANRLHFNDEREDARLTNEGMLMILCLEVEELLKAICSTSPSDAFRSGKIPNWRRLAGGDRFLPTDREEGRGNTK